MNETESYALEKLQELNRIGGFGLTEDEMLNAVTYFSNRSTEEIGEALRKYLSKIKH